MKSRNESRYAGAGGRTHCILIVPSKNNALISYLYCTPCFVRADQGACANKRFNQRTWLKSRVLYKFFISCFSTCWTVWFKYLKVCDNGQKFDCGNSDHICFYYFCSFFIFWQTWKLLLKEQKRKVLFFFVADGLSCVRKIGQQMMFLKKCHIELENHTFFCWLSYITFFMVMFWTNIFWLWRREIFTNAFAQ